MLIDEFEASGAAIGFMNYRPTGRDRDEAGPERMLSLLVNENMKYTVFVFERIRQYVLLISSQRLRSCAAAVRTARCLPIAAVAWSATR